MRRFRYTDWACGLEQIWTGPSELVAIDLIILSPSHVPSQTMWNSQRTRRQYHVELADVDQQGVGKLANERLEELHDRYDLTYGPFTSWVDTDFADILAWAKRLGAEADSA